MQVYFTCIQISISLFHTHPCTASLPSRSEVSCLICIHVTSPPFKSWYLDHNSIHVLSHTNPRFDINAWTPSRSRLTSIQVPWLAFQPHPVASQFQPGPISTLSSFLWMGVSPPSMPRLTSIQFLIVASLLHPHRVSPPPRSWYLHPISIHVASHLQVARCETCSSALSMFHPWINLLIILYSSCTWFFSALHTDTQNHYAYIMCGSVKEVWQET